MSGKGKVLIVDDDRDFVLGLGLRLRAQGFDVATALDAIGAVSMARKESPDIILLDYGLPGGNGLTVLERLKSLMLISPTIVLSASEISDLPKQMKRAGAFAFLRKPIDNAMLLSTIHRALGRMAANG